MRIAAFCLLVVLVSCSAQRAPDAAAFRPESIPFTDDKIKQLKVPAGFSVSVWAKGLGEPRMMAVAADGTVYITRDQQGDVLAIKDENGRGGAVRTVARIDEVHGIALQEKEKRIFLATPDAVYVASLKADGSIGEPEKIVTIEGRGGGHSRRTLGIGPDGNLYTSVGSTCNVCQDPPDRNALIFRSNLDGSGKQVFARGLRNTIGFDWHPETRELWGMDHGSDWRGNEIPPEELNRLVEGGHYGWPYCYADKVPDPLYRENPPGATKQKFCPTTQGAVLTTTAHSAPIEFRFYAAAMFPSDYKGDAFAAMHGSWNRKPPSGYKVLRVKFENGKPARFEDFLTGFLTADGERIFGRPAGLAVANDGALLISDDENGVIYRVSYQKPQ
jgi:glucose/arabinose dehydrogenase